jgi:hypothetical protein
MSFCAGRNPGLNYAGGASRRPFSLECALLPAGKRTGMRFCGPQKAMPERFMHVPVIPDFLFIPLTRPALRVMLLERGRNCQPGRILQNIIRKTATDLSYNFMPIAKPIV